jgi:hypothetical protein
MTASSISGPRGVLRMERDVIRVDYLTKADERWRFTDSHGHEHRWHPGNDPYPTLRPVYEEPGWCDTCHEVHEDLIDHMECRQCGDTVTPGTTGPGTEMIPGMTSYYLDDQPISPEEFEAIMNEYAGSASGDR